MRIRVDKRSGVAAYEQIADALRVAFVSGRILVGQQLPSERVLARHAGVSGAVVAQAYRTLAKEGLVRRRSRSGTFVTTKAGRMGKGAKIGRVLKHVDALVAEAKAVGLTRRETSRIVEMGIEEGWE